MAGDQVDPASSPGGERTLRHLLEEWRSAQRAWEAAATESEAVAAASRVATAWMAYQEAVDAFPGLMLLVARDDGRYVAANQAAAEVLGYEVSELVSMSVADLAAEESLPVVDDAWRAFLVAGEARGLFTLRSRAGRCVAVQFHAHARSPIPPLHTSILVPAS